MVFTVASAAAQPVRPVLRVGAAGSSTLVEDALATSGLRLRLGSALAGSVRAWAAPGPLVEAGVEVGVRPRVRLAGLVTWQGSSLQVEDGGGTRRAQDLSLLGGLLEMGFVVRGPWELTAAAGALSYRTEEEGIFAEGTDLAPLARGGAAANLAWRGHTLRLGGFAEGHPFGTSVVRRTGGGNGLVLRYGLQLGLVWGGAR